MLGVYDVYGGNIDTALREATQVSLNNPMLTVSAMAAVTEHLGFGATYTLSYEPPFTFARRMSTLDHLTRKRVGRNIVTGYLDSAARGVSGKARQKGYDTRYEIAEEYLGLVYQLLEDSAVRRDHASGVFTEAGTSSKGWDFVARHAECVFMALHAAMSPTSAAGQTKWRLGSSTPALTGSTWPT